MANPTATAVATSHTAAAAAAAAAATRRRGAGSSSSGVRLLPACDKTGEVLVALVAEVVQLLARLLCKMHHGLHCVHGHGARVGRRGGGGRVREPARPKGYRAVLTDA